MTDDHPDAGDTPSNLEPAGDSTDDAPELSRSSRFVAWLSDNLLLVASVVGLGGFVLTSMLGYEFPRNLRVIGIAALLTMPFVGRPLGKHIKAMLWNPSYVWLVDLDARREDGAIYRMPAERFREWDVVDGQLDWLSPELAIGKNVDLEAQRVEGTWRGTASDRELLRAKEAIKEIRGQLEKDAQRGFAIESQAFVIIRNTTRRAVRSIVETFENGTMPDTGDGLNDEINSAISEFGITRKVAPEDDADDDGATGTLEVDFGDLTADSPNGETDD
jgi:hypothetical protein